MKRRDVLKRAAAASLTTTVLAGTATAERPAIDLDRTIDVSGVSGPTRLVDLLDEEELALLDDAIDPERRLLHVAQGVEEVNAASCCDAGCCDAMAIDACLEMCGCCECLYCEDLVN